MARSGLDDVPGDRYIERRFTWCSLSVVSLKTSPDAEDDDGGRPVTLVADDCPATGVGVGGMTVGVVGVMHFAGGE